MYNTFEELKQFATACNTYVAQHDVPPMTAIKAVAASEGKTLNSSFPWHDVAKLMKKLNTTPVVSKAALEGLAAFLAE